MPWTRAIPSLTSHRQLLCFWAITIIVVVLGIPDGENTSSLGKAVLLLHATDPLLENGGDLGGSGLRIGSIASHLLGGGVEGDGCGAGLLREKSVSAWLRKRAPNLSSAATINHQWSSTAKPLAPKTSV